MRCLMQDQAERLGGRLRAMICDEIVVEAVVDAKCWVAQKRGPLLYS